MMENEEELEVLLPPKTTCSISTSMTLTSASVAAAAAAAYNKQNGRQ
jgi:hypothetical protein